MEDNSATEPLVLASAKPPPAAAVAGTSWTYKERMVSLFGISRRQNAAPTDSAHVATAAVGPNTFATADSLAAAAVQFGEEAARASILADEARSFAESVLFFSQAGGEAQLSSAADRLLQTASALARAADAVLEESPNASSIALAMKGLGLATSAPLLTSTEESDYKQQLGALFRLAASPAERGQQRSGASPEGSDSELKSFVQQAQRFDIEASGSTMANAAQEFAKAAEEFASGRRCYKKVTDIPLCKAGLFLGQVASTAPSEEKRLVEIARKLQGEASLLVLDDSSTTSRQSRPLSDAHRRTISKRFEWLVTSISGPVIPLHNQHLKRRAKLVEKRQVLFGIALSTPIVLLTTMKAGSVLPPEHTEWLGAVSASIWICVNAGSIMNLYGKTSFEQRAAQHLSRLGMFGLAVLVCLYMYCWFFPKLHWLFWGLLVLVSVFHVISWGVGCYRHDDDSTFESPADDPCKCARCRPCPCARCTGCTRGAATDGDHSVGHLQLTRH